MSSVTPGDVKTGAALPGLVDAARKFAEAVAATSQYEAYMAAQTALARDEEAQSVLRKYAELQQRFERGGVVFVRSPEDRAEYEKVEEALSQNERLIQVQDAQVQLVKLLRDLNRVISDKYGTNFARAAASGGGCCG
ncbi:MAG: YlbF family regulator [Bacillota bacterium]